MRRGDIVDLEITGLALGGRGLALSAGRRFEVEGCVPGDRVKARITRIRRDRVEAVVDSFDTRSQHHVPPRCSHFFTECGGCRWQDVSYESQLSFKRDIVRMCLNGVGGLGQVPLEMTVPSERIFFYRNKMEFAFGKDPSGAPIIGLHKAGSYDEIFDLRTCYLQSESSNSIVRDVRSFVRERGLAPYDPRSHSGLLRILAVREGKFTGESMVNLITSVGDFPGADDLAGCLVEGHPEVKSFFHGVNPRKADVAITSERFLLRGREVIFERIGGFLFEISPNSFFQTNSYQARRLYDMVRDAAQLGGDETVLDLYCGIGTIAIYLSGMARKVIGVESVRDAVENARENARINGIANCEFIHGPAEEVLPELVTGGIKFDVVVTDPPRAGMQKRSFRSLMELRPRRIIYVSCNPYSMAKDLRKLWQEGYEIVRVQPVDMFPHTSHIESIAEVRLPG